MEKTMRKPEDLVPMDVLEGLGIRWSDLAMWYAIGGKAGSSENEHLFYTLKKLLDQDEARARIVRLMGSDSALRYHTYKKEFEKALFPDPKQAKIDELKATAALVQQQINELENL